MDEQEQQSQNEVQEQQNVQIEPTPLSPPPSHKKLIIGIVVVFMLTSGVILGVVLANFLSQPNDKTIEEISQLTTLEESALLFAEKILTLYKNQEYGKIYDLSSEVSKSTISKDIFVNKLKNSGGNIIKWELSDQVVHEDKAYFEYYIWVYKEFEGEQGIDYDIEGPETEDFNFIKVDSKWYYFFLEDIENIKNIQSPSEREITLRDTQRISDIRQLKIGLEFYFDDKGEYPDNLSGLVPLYIYKEIADPLTNQPYFYGAFTEAPFNLENKCNNGLKKCTTYHLGTTLEDASSDVSSYALADDYDIDSDVMSGSDLSGCSFTNLEGACFDVLP